MKSSSSPTARVLIRARMVEASIVQAAKSVEALVGVLEIAEDGLLPAEARHLDAHLATMAATLREQADGLTALVLDLVTEDGVEPNTAAAPVPGPRLRELHPLRG